jgi:hypothetical protein
MCTLWLPDGTGEKFFSELHLKYARAKYREKLKILVLWIM